MAGIFKAYDIRGTYPDQIDETIAFRVGYHFRELLDDDDLALGPKVVVSRDMRSHSVPLAEALWDGLRTSGVEVVDIGVADTPMNYFAIGHLSASGGIQVTASHNPSVYNGFKMSRREAIPVSCDTGIGALERSVRASDGSHRPAAASRERPASRSSASTRARRGLARTRSEPRLKVAVDVANGMGTLYRRFSSASTSSWCRCTSSSTAPSRTTRRTRSRPRTCATSNAAVVQEHGCDLGVAFDGDADRAIFVDDDGRARSRPTW